MFTLRLAWRYAFSRSNRHRSAMFVILAGIAVGMLAIIVMLSLMNSLQSDLLDQVKSIESFHLQVTFPADTATALPMQQIVDSLKEIPHVSQVYAHVNTQVLLQNPSADRSTTARLRIVDNNIWEEDNPFSDRSVLLRGTIPGPHEIVSGSSLALKLGLGLGDPVRMTVLASGRTVVLAPSTVTMMHTGTFKTGLPEFDNATVITDIDPLLAAIGPRRVVYGLYLDDRHVDRANEIVREIVRIHPTATVKTWQQVNSAFYSALTLEKVLMYLFLFFMFIILGVNMKNASSRLLHVKQRELAVLRAVGSRRSLATKVFLGQTIIVTMIGEGLGIIAGVFAGRHIGTLFSWINTVQYQFTRRNNILLSYPFSMQVRPWEIVIIAVSVLALALLFTYAGCKRLLRREPMEMLYHD